MALKLTEKEVTALAKKVANKKQKELAASNEKLIKGKMDQAKVIMSTISGFPPAVKDFLLGNRYSHSAVTVENIAKVLSKVSVAKVDISVADQEADVVIAAHDCTTLSQLCKKLGI